MRIELLNELIEKHHVLQYDILPWEYTEPEEDDIFDGVLEPEEVYNSDGVKVVIEWELGNVFITGLTPEEIQYLKDKEEELWRGVI